jgi:hypothetical protein
MLNCVRKTRLCEPHTQQARREIPRNCSNPAAGVAFRRETKCAARSRQPRLEKACRCYVMVIVAGIMDLARIRHHCRRCVECAQFVVSMDSFAGSVQKPDRFARLDLRRTDRGPTKVPRDCAVLASHADSAPAWLLSRYFGRSVIGEMCRRLGRRGVKLVAETV